MSCKKWMIRGLLRTPDRLLELFGSSVQQSEVFRKMTSAPELYNLGGSTIVVFIMIFAIGCKYRDIRMLMFGIGNTSI
jgi:hypothetical protein